VAGALRPVVVLMALATLLFLVDGWLDGAYPGGEGWLGGPAYHGLGVLAYLFAIVNAGFAAFIARGSERTLMVRIGLAAFFLFERPLTAFVLGPKPFASVAVHAATAIVELAILGGAIWLWRLGRSVDEPDMAALFSLGRAAGPRRAEPQAGLRGAFAARATWAVAGLAAALAVALVADGIVRGFVPGGRAGEPDDASGWLAYVIAAVALGVAVVALRGGIVALRVMFAVSLLVFVERAFTPFALRLAEPVSLALHAAGAFVALALAIATASAIRTHAAGRDLTRASAGGA
jgi:hypothetical protein